MKHFTQKLKLFTWIFKYAKREVPFNPEVAIKERGADLKQAFIPMTSNVVLDGGLIAGHNFFSSKEMAKIVNRKLEQQ